MASKPSSISICNSQWIWIWLWVTATVILVRTSFSLTNGAFTFIFVLYLFSFFVLSFPMFPVFRILEHSLISNIESNAFKTLIFRMLLLFVWILLIFFHQLRFSKRRLNHRSLYSLLKYFKRKNKHAKLSFQNCL